MIVVLFAIYYLKLPASLGSSNARLVFLQTAAGVSIGAVGFAVTAASIFLAATPGARLQAILGRVGRRLTGVLMTSVATLIISAALFSFLIYLESDQPPNFLVALEVSLLLLVTLVQFRLALLFSQVFVLLASERSFE
jgi:hypothetical protein